MENPLTSDKITFPPLSLSELEGKKKSALVAEKILETVQSGRLQPETKLPSEREICEQMNVSRTIVREALSALRILGAVTVRMGEGTFVSNDLYRRHPLKETRVLLEQNDSPIEIWEARESLEKTGL